MKRISMLEFRRDARKVLAVVRKGQPVVLTYRGNAVARIVPVRDEQDPVPPDDALLRIDDFAVDGPGGSLSNEEIDRTVYGSKAVR